jgi:Flp/Fap pilin component
LSPPTRQPHFSVIDFTSALLGRPTLASAMITKIYQFLRDESGATFVEIGVIVAGISLVIIAAANGKAPNSTRSCSGLTVEVRPHHAALAILGCHRRRAPRRRRSSL